MSFQNFAFEGTENDDFFEFSTPDIYHIRAHGGNDTVRLTDALHGHLDGGAGDDLIEMIGRSSGILIGGLGSDTLIGGTGRNYFYEADEHDTLIEGGATNDVVVAAFDLTLGEGFEGAELEGFTARTLVGNNADNNLDITDIDHRLGVSVSGLDGNDCLYGSWGRDTLSGGAGNDTITGGGRTDVMDGGTGLDVADYLSDTQAPIRANLVTGWVQFVGTNWAPEHLTNFEGIFTSAANDVLFGSGRNDIIRSGGGNDRISGGFGADEMESGDGNAVFNYRSTADSRWGRFDTITDFAGVGKRWGDKINLSQVDADETIAGDQNFIFGSTGIGGLFTRNAAGGNTWVFGNTDNDARAELVILLHEDDVCECDPSWAGDYRAFDFIL